MSVSCAARSSSSREKRCPCATDAGILAASWCVRRSISVASLASCSTTSLHHQRRRDTEKARERESGRAAAAEPRLCCRSGLGSRPGSFALRCVTRPWPQRAGLTTRDPWICHRSTSAAAIPHSFVGRAQLGVIHGKDSFPRLAFISSSCTLRRTRIWATEHWVWLRRGGAAAGCSPSSRV